jgi:hypothetical protein
MRLGSDQAVACSLPSAAMPAGPFRLRTFFVFEAALAVLTGRLRPLKRKYLPACSSAKAAGRGGRGAETRSHAIRAGRDLDQMDLVRGRLGACETVVGADCETAGCDEGAQATTTNTEANSRCAPRILMLNERFTLRSSYKC